MKLKLGLFAILAICLLMLSGCFLFEFDDESCEHDWQWMETSPPTETTAGIETKNCAKCGEKDGTREGRPPIVSNDCQCDEVPEFCVCFGEGDYSQGVVGPLLQTTWGMGSPYRDTMPGNSRFGCVGVAVAQLMRYHEHPVRGSGQREAYTTETGVSVPFVNFEEVFFDWNNTQNKYTSTNRGTEQQLNAIQNIYRNVGIGIGMHFGLNNTGGSVSATPLVRGMTTYFGYDKSIMFISRSWYDDNAWEAIIRQQLDEGLPVYYRGNNRNNTSNHGFVIDGYDNTGKYHINWGWNGSRDGWYSLDELNPGSYDFNYGQGMIINFKPDEGGEGSNEMVLLAFTPEKNPVRQNEQFNVNANLRSLGIFSGGHVGVALVDSDNNIVEIIGMNGRAVGSFGALTVSSRSANISCYVPETVNTGVHSLRIIIRSDDGEWQVVTMSNSNVLNAIDLTVEPHAGNNPGGGYGLSLEQFYVVDDKLSVSHGERFNVTVRMRKLGEDVFPGGRLGVALVDEDGDIVRVIRDINWNLQNPGRGYRGETINNCSVPIDVPSGEYKLMIVTKLSDSDEWRLNTLSLNIPNRIDFTVK